MELTKPMFHEPLIDVFETRIGVRFATFVVALTTFVVRLFASVRTTIMQKLLAFHFAFAIVESSHRGENNMFEIIHRVDGRLQAVVVAAKDETEAQDAFIAHYEARGLLHGEILNIEEV